jgi:hypothetical protein
MLEAPEIRRETAYEVHFTEACPVQFFEEEERSGFNQGKAYFIGAVKIVHQIDPK